MTVILKQGKPASEGAILAVEAVLGLRFSPSFRTFLKGDDGATPESNTFSIGDGNDSGVARFIPVAEIPEERGYLGSLPALAYPVAWDACGNCVLIDESRGGAVFFWDHELEEPMTELAANFDGFLELMKPFDPASITLEPGQVEEVWIDPEFLKSLNKK